MAATTQHLIIWRKALWYQNDYPQLPITATLSFSPEKPNLLADYEVLFCRIKLDIMNVYQRQIFVDLEPGQHSGHIYNMLVFTICLMICTHMQVTNAISHRSLFTSTLSYDKLQCKFAIYSPRPKKIAVPNWVWDATNHNVQIPIESRGTKQIAFANRASFTYEWT